MSETERPDLPEFPKEYQKIFDRPRGEQEALSELATRGYDISHLPTKRDSITLTFFKSDFGKEMILKEKYGQDNLLVIFQLIVDDREKLFDILLMFLTPESKRQLQADDMRFIDVGEDGIDIEHSHPLKVRLASLYPSDINGVGKILDLFLDLQRFTRKQLQDTLGAQAAPPPKDTKKKKVTRSQSK